MGAGQSQGCRSSSCLPSAPLASPHHVVTILARLRTMGWEVGSWEKMETSYELQVSEEALPKKLSLRSGKCPTASALRGPVKTLTTF